MQTNHLTGLTDAQVAQSREKNGANILTPPKKDSLFKKFLEKFGDPLIIILLVAGSQHLHWHFNFTGCIVDRYLML